MNIVTTIIQISPIFITKDIMHMKKYILSETQVKKMIDKIMAEQTNIVENESQIDENIKYGGHEFQIIKTKNGAIKAGKDGILGDHNVLISWDIIMKLLDKFKI